MVSYKHYGDAKLYEQIIKANPKVEISPTLESGIKLKIPVISNQENIKFELPPWRE